MVANKYLILNNFIINATHNRYSYYMGGNVSRHIKLPKIYLKGTVLRDF